MSPRGRIKLRRQESFECARYGCKMMFNKDHPKRLYCSLECREITHERRWVTVRRDLLEAKGIKVKDVR